MTPKIKFVLATGLALILVWGCNRHAEQLRRLPTPDLAGAEPQVAAKIERSLAAVRRNPGRAEAWGNLAMHLHAHDFLPEAAICYRQAMALDPTAFRWPYYYALLLEHSRSDSLLDWLQISARCRPDYPPLLLRLGRAYLEAGDLQRADSLFSRALETATPELRVAAIAGKIRVALAQQNLEAASRWAARGRAADSLSRELLSLAAEVARRRGEFRTAGALLARAQARPPTAPFPDSLYEALLAEGVSSLAYRTRGERLLEAGRTREATEAFRQALLYKPSAPGAIYLGELYASLGEDSLAEAQFRSALELDPNATDAMVGMARSAFRRKDLAAAEAWSRRAIRVDPRRADLYEILAESEIARGRYRDALLTYRRGYELTGGHPGLGARLAWLLATIDDAAVRDGKAALALAQRLAAATPSPNPQLLDALAAAYAETGDFRSAIRTVRQAITAAGAIRDSVFVQALRARLNLYRNKAVYRIHPVMPQ